MSIELTEHAAAAASTQDRVIVAAPASTIPSDGLLRVLPAQEEECASNGVSNGHHQHNHSNNGNQNNDSNKLSVTLLAVLVFYSVSGGPFGVEASVRSAGNLYTLLGFLVAPLIWSIPEAIMTAELTPTFPEAAGGMIWVQEAFGEGAGWMAGYLGWIAGATDNAIYPVLFLDYLIVEVLSTTEEESDHHVLVRNPLARFVFLAATSVGLAYVNWCGLPVVGRMSVVICCVAMSPFVILTVVGAFQVDPSRWFELPSSSEEAAAAAAVTNDNDTDIGGGLFPHAVVGGLAIRPFLNNLFWNLNSFDAGSSFAEDVTDPGRVFPRAMVWAVVMVVAGYFVPLLVALGASSAEHYEWVDGYFAEAASEIVGPWLGAWTVFAAGISNIALFQAELSADSFQLMGMAERGHVPSIFAQRSRHGTPTGGIILGTAVIVAMGLSNLDKLIEMLNFNYAISLLMEYCAFIKLRISRPELHRPWRCPLSTFGCVLLFIPTFGFTLAILLLADYTTYFFSVGVNLVGILLYMARKRGVWGGAFTKTDYDRVNFASEADDLTNGELTPQMPDEDEDEVAELGDRGILGEIVEGHDVT